MKPNDEFDKFFGEMKHIDRSSKAREKSWLALKGRMEKPKRRRVFPAVISLAVIAIASFLLVTYILPSDTEQATDSLAREEVIMGFLEKQYNGPDLEFKRLYNNWMEIENGTENQEKSEEQSNFVNYIKTSFEDYIVEEKISSFINTNLIYQYQYFLIDRDLQMTLDKATIEQDKDHPNIYRPIIEVTLTNSKGQKIAHTLRDEIIFSSEEVYKIGRYNNAKNGGLRELYEKINNFDSYISQANQSPEALSNEEAIMGFLEKQYNGPDMEYDRLFNDWFDLQGRTTINTQEEYDKLQESEEATNYIDYFYTTFGEYVREDKLPSFINTNLLFQYQFRLIDNNVQMKLENVTIKQDQDYPNIYRPIIEVSLTNNKGQQIFHTLREEFIFSDNQPGKIGSYSWIKDGGRVELYDKIENFDAFVTSGEN